MQRTIALHGGGELVVEVEKQTTSVLLALPGQDVAAAELNATALEQLVNALWSALETVRPITRHSHGDGVCGVPTCRG